MASFRGLKDENLNRQLERVSEKRLLGNKFSDVNAKCILWILTHISKIKTFYRLSLSIRPLRLPESLV